MVQQLLDDEAVRHTDSQSAILMVRALSGLWDIGDVHVLVLIESHREVVGNSTRDLGASSTHKTSIE